jgi:hypothetical protein
MACTCNKTSPNCEPCAFCVPPGVTNLPSCDGDCPCTDESIDLKCVTYTGQGCQYLGFEAGDNIFTVLFSILDVLYPASICCPFQGTVSFVTTTTTTSTTTSTTTTTTIAPVSKCITFTRISLSGTPKISWYDSNGVLHKDVPWIWGGLGNVYKVCGYNADASGGVGIDIGASCSNASPCSCPCVKFEVVDNSCDDPIYLHWTDCNGVNHDKQWTSSLSTSSVYKVCGYNAETDAPCVDVTVTGENCINGACPTTTTTSTTTSTTSTTTSTSTTSTTSTTTRPPEQFFINTDQLQKVTFLIQSSSLPFRIRWKPATNPSQADTYQPGAIRSITKDLAALGNSDSYIIIESADLTDIKSFEISGGSDAPVPNINVLADYYPIKILGSELKKLDGLSWFVLRANSYLVNTSTIDLPRTLQTISIIPFADLRGSVTNLPSSLVSMYIYDGNTLEGTIQQMTTACPNLTTIEISGSTTLGGSIANMNPLTKAFNIYGNNTIEGNLNQIPGTPSSGMNNQNLTMFQVFGKNTIKGDLNSMNWSKITYFGIGGNLENQSLATTSYITGSVDALPTLQNGGKFKKSTDVGGGLINFQVTNGFNNITGNVSNFPDSLVSFVVRGEQALATGTNTSYGNTLCGNLSSLPSTNVTKLSIGGYNTITGALSTYGAAPNIKVFEINGNNTISGDLANVKPGLNSFSLTGANTVRTYSTSVNWGGSATGLINAFVFYSSATGNRGLNVSADYARLITDLSTRTWYDDSNVLRRVQIAIISSVSTTGSPDYKPTNAVAAYDLLKSKLQTNPNGLIISVY